jgi:hypothetical protein
MLTRVYYYQLLPIEVSPPHQHLCCKTEINNFNGTTKNSFYVSVKQFQP